MIEQTPEKDIKQKQNNHNDEEIEIDLIGILRKIIGIRNLQSCRYWLGYRYHCSYKYSQTIYSWSNPFP